VHAPLGELREHDFVPFRRLTERFRLGDNGSPAAMSAHVTYASIDACGPASVSEKVTSEIIRGDIGFDGLLMSDDVSMQALDGTIGERCRAVIAAGSDIILHCNGKMPEMLDAAGTAPLLAGRALERFERCLEVVRRAPRPVDDKIMRAALQRVREGVNA
jgi:beta-N-acetylhexosaminidase